MERTMKQLSVRDEMNESSLTCNIRRVHKLLLKV